MSTTKSPITPRIQVETEQEFSEEGAFEPLSEPEEMQPATRSLIAFHSNDFAARLQRAKMLGTYKKCVELEYGTHEVIGVLRPLVQLSNDLEVVDEATGEVSIEHHPGRVYHQLKLKLKNGTVMMAAGKAAEKFWTEDLAGQLGLPDDCGDFPPDVSLTIKIAQETLKGKTADGANRKWPVFTLV